MNNMAIVGLIFWASGVISVLSGICCMLDYMEDKEDKKNYIIFYVSLAVCIFCFLIMIIYSIKHPQPTFREVCEANNGIYIANNGRAGDSCIYNKGGE